MISIHLTDEELTAAAAGERSPRTAGHLEICPQCWEQMSIYRGEINERLQSGAATTRTHRAVDLVRRIIVRADHRADRAGVVVENDHRGLRNVVTIHRREM